MRDLRSERLASASRSTSWHRDDGPGRRQELSSLVDGWLGDLWGTAIQQAPGGRDPTGVALAAVGSLARRDAGPTSDLDLVLLHDGHGRTVAQVAALADRVWYPVWDAKLRLDHSVRTPAPVP